VKAGRTAVVSEESRTHWNLRGQRLDFGNHSCFFCRPFRGKPTASEWVELIDFLGERAVGDGLDLVAIDPLATFLPGRDESNAGVVLEALMPLRRLLGQGLGVWLLHHPRKGEAPEGQAARGSGALTGFADIVVEMGCLGRLAGEDRRRVLKGYSRYPETPRELVIELTEAGDDYRALGSVWENEFRESWERLRGLLACARGKLSRRQVRESCPGDDNPPSEATLRRWLEQAVEAGLVQREGGGTNERPFHYWLPGMEEIWKNDPDHKLFELQQAAMEGRLDSFFKNT
jgi:hypothetical protein